MTDNFNKSRGEGFCLGKESDRRSLSSWFRIWAPAVIGASGELSTMPWAAVCSIQRGFYVAELLSFGLPVLPDPLPPEDAEGFDAFGVGLGLVSTAFEG